MECQEENSRYGAIVRNFALKYSSKDRGNQWLFVEASKDGDFYQNVCLNSNINFGGKVINFDPSEESILSLGHIKKIGPLPDYAFELVAKCMRWFEKNQATGSFKNVHIFGIIDRDFGHDDLIEGINNISTTKFHDIETTVLRSFLPTYFKKKFCVELQEKNIELFTNIIDFCFKQGLLEEESFKYENKYERNESLVYFTHTYFKDRINLISSTFDFMDHVKWHHYRSIINDQNKTRNAKHISLMNEDDYERHFLGGFLKRYSQSYEDKFELQQILYRWIIFEKPTEDDNKLLDKIFEKCNGHILLNQMIIGTSPKLFSFANEFDFWDDIQKEYLACGNRKTLFNIAPLESYKRYRWKNKLFNYAK